MGSSLTVLSIAALGACMFSVPCAAADAVSFVSVPVLSASPRVSQATDQRSYRVDGAKHIYNAYASRIYRGKLPPLIHAIVVVETVLDDAGQLKEINVIRAPSHAPDVTAAVREMIQRIAPFPAPANISGGVRYTETWLVDRSGRFQVDTLTEGQRGGE